MCQQISADNREILSIISGVSRALRCCQQEPVFCEDVTFSQFFILDRVGEKGALRLAELHEILSVDKSTTTRLVTPLVNQGLVLRKKSKDDSRAIILKLTQKGKRVREKVLVCLSEFLDNVENGIPKKKRAHVYESVRLFLDAIQRACASPKCSS